MCLFCFIYKLYNINNRWNNMGIGRIYKEKRIERLIDIPDSIIKKINIICNKNEEINSLNDFVNKAIRNNIKDDIERIYVSVRSDAEPSKLRIYKSLNDQMNNIVRKRNISVSKLVLHYIIEELKKI